MFWQKASTEVKKSWVEGVVPSVAKRKRNTAETRVEMASVPLRPRKGESWSTRYAAKRLPGTPTTEMMA